MIITRVYCHNVGKSRVDKLHPYMSVMQSLGSHDWISLLNADENRQKLLLSLEKRVQDINIFFFQTRSLFYFFITILFLLNSIADSG